MQNELVGIESAKQLGYPTRMPLQVTQNIELNRRGSTVFYRGMYGGFAWLELPFSTGVLEIHRKVSRRGHCSIKSGRCAGCELIKWYSEGTTTGRGTFWGRAERCGSVVPRSGLCTK